MSYINTDSITDIHARRIIDGEVGATISTEALVKADRDINIVCLDTGVSVDLIPVDIDGYTTSDVLIMYGQVMYMIHVFESVLGGVELDDVYKAKIEYYTHMSEVYKKKITYTTITGNEEIRLANRIRSKPIW